MVIIMLAAKELADLTVAMQGQPSQKVTSSPEEILKAIRDTQREYEASKKPEQKADRSPDIQS